MRSQGIAIAIGLLASLSPATADPLFRFGLTSGANRHTKEGAEFGPMFALGGTAGRFTGEASYSFLSFADTTGIHRAGATLRGDLTTWGTANYKKTVYTEVGVSHRWGIWRVSNEIIGAERSQNEAHLGVGYQLDDKWQLGLRLGIARPDANQPVMCPAGVLCRQITMESPTDAVSSVMLEWMYLLGR
jgi:hypothetical protein